MPSDLAVWQQRWMRQPPRLPRLPPSTGMNPANYKEWIGIRTQIKIFGDFTCRRCKPAIPTLQLSIPFQLRGNFRRRRRTRGSRSRHVELQEAAMDLPFAAQLMRTRCGAAGRDFSHLLAGYPSHGMREWQIRWFFTCATLPVRIHHVDVQ